MCLTWQTALNKFSKAQFPYSLDRDRCLMSIQAQNNNNLGETALGLHFSYLGHPNSFNQGVEGGQNHRLCHRFNKDSSSLLDEGNDKNAFKLP